VKHEGVAANFLLLIKIMTLIKKKVLGNSCASTSGNTGGTSVIHRD